MPDIDWIVGREYETRDAGNVICVGVYRDEKEYQVIARPVDPRLRSYWIMLSGQLYNAEDSWDEHDVISGPLPEEAIQHISPIGLAAYSDVGATTIHEWTTDVLAPCMIAAEYDAAVDGLAVPGDEPTPDPTPEACGNCRFWLKLRESITSDGFNSAQGDCRLWPEFYGKLDAEWCGQWEAKR